MTNLEGLRSKEKHSLFSWHHGDVALIYAWIALIVVGSCVAIFQNLNQKWQLSIATYNYWVNFLVTGTFLFVTEVRLGKRFNVPATYAKPPLFAMALAYHYYYMKQKGMYLESHLVSFLMFLLLIPLIKYGPGWIPKRPGGKAKRLPPLIK